MGYCETLDSMRQVIRPLLSAVQHAEDSHAIGDDEIVSRDVV